MINTIIAAWNQGFKSLLKDNCSQYMVVVTGFLLVLGFGWEPPLPKKLAFPPLFCPQNVDFVIFIQFSAILPNLSPPLS